MSYICTTKLKMQSEKRNIKIGTISKITAYPVKRPIVHL